MNIVVPTVSVSAVIGVVVVEMGRTNRIVGFHTLRATRVVIEAL